MNGDGTRAILTLENGVDHDNVLDALLDEGNCGSEASWASTDNEHLGFLW